MAIAQTKNILLIEDDEVDAEIIRRLLLSSDNAFECTHVTTSEAAIDMLQHSSFDCLLLDYKLPGLSGFEFLQKIRDQKELQFTPIIMITGCGDEVVATKTLKSGADNYIAKEKVTKESLQKAIENAIDSSMKAKEVSKKYDDLTLFANVIAHDMAAPIRTILYLAEKLKEKDCCIDDSDYTAKADQIYKSASNLGQMIKSLHSSCTLDNNSIAFSWIDLRELFRQTMVSLESLRTDRQVDINIISTLPKVYGHKESLTQVFLNLISNSVKFSRPSMPVRIEVSHEHFKKWLHIFYKDNSVGLNHDDHKEIFSPFKKGYHAKKNEGMGLGLSLCKKIMQQHGGDIKIHSSCGDGATFLLVFPKPVHDQKHHDIAANAF